MCFIWFGLKLWMKLYPHIPRVIFNLHDFNQIPFRIYPGNEQARFFHLLAVRIVEFESMTVSFRYFIFAICGMS